MRHDSPELLPTRRVTLCHHCRAAIHPRVGWVADCGQRDNFSSGVGKLDCLRGYRRACVDRFRCITPSLKQLASELSANETRRARVDFSGLSIRSRRDLPYTIHPRSLALALASFHALARNSDFFSVMRRSSVTGLFLAIRPIPLKGLW